MNRKLEHSCNEIIRMESCKYSWDEEKDRQEDMRDRNRRSQNTRTFIDVISVVSNVTTTESSNLAHTSRYSTRKRGVVLICDRRMRPRLETSTPLRHTGLYGDDGVTLDSSDDNVVGLNGSNKDINYTEAQEETHSESQEPVLMCLMILVC